MDNVLETLTVARSGKLGQVIHSRNTAGPYTRPFVIPSDPLTPMQARRRARFRFAALSWRLALTPIERQSWELYATRMKYVAVTGRGHHLSGQQMYIRNIAGRLLAAFGNPRTAPAGSTNGSYDPPGVQDLAGSGTIIVTINTSDEWVTQTGSFLFVYVSDRRSPTINFFNGPFKFAGAIAGDAVTPPPLINPLTDPFGAAAENRRTSRTRVAFADARLTDARIREFTDNP